MIFDAVHHTLCQRSSSKNLGGPVVIWWAKSAPLVRIGLDDFQILSRIFNNGLLMQHIREKNCTSHIHGGCQKAISVSIL